ncbi:MAG: alpha/beta hydrolase, partial [Methanoregula sp.]
PKNHPGSRRISYVVSVGPEIFTSCSIQRGTHPDQHLICSSGELSGMTLKGKEGGVDISPMQPDISVQHVKFKMETEFF